MKWDGRIQADARNLPIANESVQCVVTSPPYWGLRDYGHEGQIGLETTPGEYVALMVNVFREVWRVLKPDGTIWVNLGDSYAGSWGSLGRQGHGEMTSRSIVSARQIAHAARKRSRIGSAAGLGLKEKDICGIPWRVAFALQEDGWYLRSDIIWSKPNPMPESVKDRPTKSHEYIFLLSKNKHYYYDGDAIKEKTTGNAHPRGAGVNPKAKFPSGWASGADPQNAIALNQEPLDRRSEKEISAPERARSSSSTRMGRGAGWRCKQNESFSAAVSGPTLTRNKRTVWTVPTTPYPEAHYATFPPKLISPCILASTRPGDIVMDMFCGSGTVGAESERLSRKWIGIDLGYQDLQMKRMRGIQKKILLKGDSNC